MSGRTPHDLAVFVYGRLDDDESRPSVEILDDLFRTVFITSLKTEEATHIACSIAYANPKNPDPAPPRRIRHPRWRYTAFAEPLDFDVSQLTKIGMAFDSSSSSLAVYPDRKGKLKIWGLFDQQGGFHSFLNHEAGSGFDPPGIMQVQILGVGGILVTTGLAVIGELNGDVLVEDSVEVFTSRIILAKLVGGCERRLDRIGQHIAKEGLSFDSTHRNFILPSWINSIRRILLRARAFGHGGAFLITDSDQPDRLRIKHKLRYERLPTIFEHWLSSLEIRRQSHELIIADREEDPDVIDSTLFSQYVIALNNIDDAEEAMTGAVSLVASLSRIDGLVLMNTDLVVKGFGCEITAQGDRNCSSFQADDPNPTKGKIRPLDTQRYGTRHRSMIRYCSEDQSAVGFIVSNDGPVRAITRHGKRVYLWDNVQLGKSFPLRGD